MTTHTQFEIFGYSALYPVLIVMYLILVVDTHVLLVTRSLQITC